MMASKGQCFCLHLFSFFLVFQVCTNIYVSERPMARTFVVFDKDGKPAERPDEYFPLVQMDKEEFVNRRRGHVADENLFAVDGDLILSHLIMGTQIMYDAEKNAVHSCDTGESEADGSIPISVRVLSDEFVVRHESQPDCLAWGSEAPSVYAG
ncbi:hypothetical protein, conserved [Trypanosoma brucei gambiense DAL972]|uniref:T. brucei spp.-specific protein n=1 Tax=Trypanosoma brucei gambiense (strain MHOM/CI/86/DAL972) TaxID=679716 RepID=C9ZIT1_TRYB9|nr:hypothetical protein, conserved [Trypanosoma brucei gambiense DAL972]CBH09073.1 hypothetical protein, conserved [Trypanosoma brucei gambiense DAL972]|eukprot:XP_011771514.1 hypothetical protein, conserved [Trypanosoma brucei gambiense DAL972]